MTPSCWRDSQVSEAVSLQRSSDMWRKEADCCCTRGPAPRSNRTPNYCRGLAVGGLRKQPARQGQAMQLLRWARWILSINYFGVSTEMRRRSEEHTSELQSRGHLVCSLLLE